MNIRQRNVLIQLLGLNDYVSGQALAGQYKVSSKTIYADLKRLETLLEREGLQLVRLPRHGIKIEGTYFQKEKLKNQLTDWKDTTNNKDFQEREKDYLRKLFLETQALVVADLSEDFYLSETSVRRDLDKLEKTILTHGIRLMRANGSLMLEGEETELRNYLRYVLLEGSQNAKSKQNELTFLSTFFLDEKVELLLLFQIII
ncbi:HTH domain-containing protein [Streptococcus ictaluri]|uniref:HTH domain protein n=1 Tax=Streptococcus ictaluri 707-05 TaxID=764299 RepID=G5K552_9STRE|nr:HTH domain-containing protein [Streptococcus ictaluri]EHI69284.1 HTH domain protein [Streptococcus ictaluri 707-05]